ncbi:phosphotransferase family protein [Actinomadura roseirufa]|uniref:phosphotransferase family protein n=1 Tax=Actinomadura roseirufa TaxID=2094049 RepID=UPI001F5EAE93|nr:phosphotransferase [Actinomadura roseirufa]
MHTETAQSGLFARLVEIGRESARVTERYAAHRSFYAAPNAAPHVPPSPPEPETLYDRHGVLVVRVGDVVVKAHQPDREYGSAFLERTSLAAGFPRIVLGVLDGPYDVDGRTVTVSLYGEPVNPREPLPWEEGARLLAALHSAAVPEGAPSWGRPGRIARLVSRLGNGPAEDAVRRAFGTLPPWIRGEGTEPARDVECVIHGDWHLGQMVRGPGGGWLLIDVEDLGRGVPAWDLARPAALYSAGVLHPEEWERFLGSYREAGGPAVPPAGDPWAALDIPARSLAIQIAATCVISAGREDRSLDESEQAMVDACERISAAGAPA